MTSERPIQKPEPVSCALCHVEIPRAESLSVEGKEYVYYFCGHGCYSHWNENMEEKKRGNPLPGGSGGK